MQHERKCEIFGVLLICLTMLLFLALVGDDFNTAAPGARDLDAMADSPNILGAPGAVVAWTLALLVGDAAHILWAVTFIWGLMLVCHRPVNRLLTRLAGLGILTGAVAGLLQVDVAAGVSNPPQPGGAFGAFVADEFFVRHFGVIGSNVVGVTMALIGILLTTDFLFIHILVVARRVSAHLIRGGLALFDAGTALWHGYCEEARVRAERKTARLKKRGKRSEKPASAVRLRNVAPAEPAPSGDADDLQRIRVRPEDPPAQPASQDVPFDAIPEITDTPVPLLDEEMPAAVTLGLDPVPASGQLDLVAEGTEPAPQPKPKNPRPRRKTVELDELPPDFEYPKRYTPPAIDMLDRPEPRCIPDLGEQLRATSVLLEETLQTFGIEARVTDVTRGPTITRFELEPAPGIKVSRFLSLADDIALALKAHRVRVEAPIPGKGRVGIEAPNLERDQVLIRELLESPGYKRGKGQLKLALGKDITGDVKIVDLAAMPHLLVAGATGAGKTVCVKALLASLLFRHTPDELQLMLIDPKMVELSIFNDIPHLITPVVTDPKKAASSLNWLITEMEERYRLFADLRVRNVEVYNKSVENGEIEMEGGEGAPDPHAVSLIRKLPYIVCIIDELADLMMLARSEVEDAIARLAQLARAVGIHLIIATQRPSVDVLTGVIKANFPARVSFQVSSRVDSRCILDEIGAERLIGMGDLLYLPAGQSKPTRLQGAFVSDEEMNSLIAYLKRQAPPQYRDEIENFGKSKDNLEELAGESDPLFDEAVQVVLDTGQASISMVQRRLRVGYTRAARLIDMMELKGIVGPHTGSKAREILVDAAPQDDVA